MYKKIIFLAVIMLSAVITFAQPSQYTPMTAQGYQFKRILCDSTLHLPSFCGIPNLRNSTAKNGALAIDTCNNRLYQWTRLSGWSIVGGTTIDTTSLSNRINTKIDSLKRSTDSIFARVNGVWKFQYKDSTGGGSTPSLQQVTDVGNTTDKSITIGVGGEQGLLNLNTWNNDNFRNKFIDYNGEAELFGGGYFQVIDSFSKNMSIQFGNTNGSFSGTSNYIGEKSTSYITNIPTIELNSINKSVLITPNEQFYKNNPSNSLTLIPDYFGYDDTLNYPTNNGVKDTIATVFDVRQKLNISDTATMLTPYLRKIDTASLSNRIDLRVKYSDTATMLTPYLRKVDTSSLSNRINTKLNISDTTNKWVTSVTKLNDSTIRVVKNTTTTDITLTPAATVTAATRLVTTVYNNSGSTITKGSVVYINGRHSSNLPTIALAQANTEDNSYSTFALVQDDIPTSNSGIAIQAGNIGNLNLPTSSYTDGQVIYLSPTVAGGLTTNKTSVLAPNHIVKIGTITRAHPTAGSIEIKIENGWQLDELSDVQIPVVPNDSTLLQFSRVDSLWHSVGITNAIGTNYIKPSDTATMLTKYLRKTDTASLSSRIDLRVRYSDTATMLTPYLRKVDTTGKFVNNITRTAGKDSIIFFIGGTRYAIKDSVGGGGGSAAGSTGNVQYNNGGAFAGSNNLFWDNTNSRLGIGTTSPTVNLNVVSSTNTGITARNTSTSGRADLLVTNDAGNVGGFTIYGSAFGAPFSNNVAVTSFKSLGMYTDGGVINGGTSTMDFITGGYNNSPTMRITGGNTGNVLIGTTTDAGYKLDVNGTTRLNGSTTLGSTGFWDNTNTRLGIGTTSPSNRFHLTGSITASAGSAVSSNINPTLVAAANNDRLVGLDINPTFTNGAFTGVWNVPLRVSNDVIIGTDITTLNSGSFVNEKVFIGRNGSGTSNGFLGLLVNNLAAPTAGISTGALLGFNASTTNFYGQGLSDARNSKFDIWFQTGAVNGGGYRFYTGTQENVTIFDNGNMLLQAGGTKTNAGFRLDVNGTARIQGALNFNPTNTAAGTTGNQTINKASGTVNIAAAGTTITVTNSLVTTSSIVFATIRTNDATAVIKNVVPAAGSFTINLNAAATAETSIGFFVIN